MEGAYAFAIVDWLQFSIFAAFISLHPWIEWLTQRRKKNHIHHLHLSIHHRSIHRSICVLDLIWFDCILCLSMKSSLKKLRGLGLHNHNHKHHDSKTILPLGQLEELAQATRVRNLLLSCLSDWFVSFRVWWNEIGISGHARHERLLRYLAFCRRSNCQQCLWIRRVLAGHGLLSSRENCFEWSRRRNWKSSAHAWQNPVQTSETHW